MLRRKTERKICRRLRHFPAKKWKIVDDDVDLHPVKETENEAASPVQQRTTWDAVVVAAAVAAGEWPKPLRLLLLRRRGSSEAPFSTVSWLRRKEKEENRDEENDAEWENL